MPNHRANGLPVRLGFFEESTKRICVYLCPLRMVTIGINGIGGLFGMVGFYWEGLIFSVGGLHFRSFCSSYSISFDDLSEMLTSLLVRHAFGLSSHLSMSFPQPFFGIKAGDRLDLG